jgi:hypothetical protein
MQKNKSRDKIPRKKKAEDLPQLHFPGQKGKFCAEKVSFRYTIKSGDWKDADLTAVNMTRTMISELFLDTAPLFGFGLDSTDAKTQNIKTARPQVLWPHMRQDRESK